MSNSDRRLVSFVIKCHTNGEEWGGGGNFRSLVNNDNDDDDDDDDDGVSSNIESRNIELRTVSGRTLRISMRQTSILG
ncbi:hypothetical protein V1478_013935 [Vespula squamosa]|uniref:Uncharacterized protein n=1 Tax=Vespula squamosa TaxID=30214 RepID=A0ABD2A6L5_VESSQ